MAFEVGAIKGVFALDDRFSKPMLSIYDSVNKTLNKFAEIPKVAGDAARQTAQAVSKASNTINGMTDRVQRLQNLLNKSQVGSVRFENLSKALRESQKELDKTTGSLNKMNPALAMAGSALAAVSAVSILKGIVDITARFEKYQVILTKTLGSQSDAVKAMDMIAKVAAKTPFSVDQLTDSFVKFANRGVKPSAEEIERMGDVASVVGKDFDQLTEAILDVSNSERWKELGIVSEQAGNKLRLSFKGVTVEGEKTVQGAKDLVVQLGKMNGVLGANEAIAGSAVGKFSNLGDATDALYLSIGKLLLPALTRIVEVLIDISTAITDFIENNKAAIKAVATFIAMATGLKALSIGFTLIRDALVTLPALIRAAGIAMSTAFGPASVAFLAVAGMVALYQFMQDKATETQQRIEQTSDTFALLGKNSNPREFALAVSTLKTLNKTMGYTEDGFQKLSAKLSKGGIDTRVFMENIGGVWSINEQKLAAYIRRLEKVEPSAKKGKSGITDLTKAIKDLKAESEGFNYGGMNFDLLPNEQEMQKLSSDLQSVFSQLSNMVLGPIMENFTARLGNQLQNITNRGRIFDVMAQVYTTREREANEAELENFKELQDNELEAFKARQEAEIELERKRADESIAILSDEYIKRKELSDQEFADKKAKADLEFQNFVALEQLKFEAQRAKIEQESVDKEQAQIADALMEEDWKRYLETLEAGHNENLILISQQKSESESLLQAEEDKKKQELQAKNDERLIALEKSKADAIAAAEEAKEDRIFAKQEEIKAKEKESSKRITAVKYAIDIAALEVQKQIARAQAAMSYATGAMSAVSMAPQTSGASLLLLPLLQSTYALTMAGISSQFVAPPAELFLKTGGVIVPGAGMSDTVPARLTPGEMVVDRSTTQGLKEMVSDGGNKGNIQIIFHPGSIVNSGNMDDRAMDALSFEISRRLERSQSRG